MQVVIDIPEEFEKHFNDDNFKDSFERIKADINYTGLLSGNYEIETLDMLIKAFKECTPFQKNKALEQEDSVLDKIRAEINSPNRGTCDYFIVDRIEEIIDKYKAAGKDKEKIPSKTEVTPGRAKEMESEQSEEMKSECNEEMKNEYEYYMSVPVSGRLDAHVISETPLTKEEVMQKAFESANFGELEDFDITPETDIDELYFEGEVASEEHGDYE